MATLPELPQDINGARLPAVYEEAKRALAECSRIDECMEWANKAEAIASYARQSKDDSLQKMAVRIQGRAIRRCGELLKFFKSVGGRPTAEEKLVGAPPPVSQKTVGTEAGMSKDQMVTAVRVANVPAKDFERQMASEKPPSVTKLAEQGTRKPVFDLGTIKPADHIAAGHAIGELNRFVELANTHDPVQVAAGMKDREKAEARRNIAVIDSWLDRLIVSL
jgi:hypothetical protein